MKEFWGGPYRKYDDDTHTTWNAEHKVECTREDREERHGREEAAMRLERVEGTAEEHIETLGLQEMEMARRVEGRFIHLKEQIINGEGVTKCFE